MELVVGYESGIRIALKVQDADKPYGSWWVAVAIDSGQSDERVAGNGEIVPESIARWLMGTFSLGHKLWLADKSIKLDSLRYHT